MGLFGRRKSDDDEFESMTSSPPPSSIKLHPPPPPMPSAPPRKLAQEDIEEQSMKPLPVPEFSIDEAISLIRQLPNRSLELVMQVVKKTLESVGVDLQTIIDGATQREENLETRIIELRNEIDGLEVEIATKKKEIARLETEQREVSQVKERLTLAVKLESSGDGMSPDRASRVPPPPLGTTPQPGPAPTPMGPPLTPTVPKP